jgi:flagella basal body P-ring formation protein FlgA
MSPKRIIAAFAVLALIIVGIVIAVQPSAKRIESSMHEKSHTGKASQEQITLVFCKRDVAKGKVFANEDLEIAKRSLQKYPQDAISDPAEVVGRVAKYSIKAGSMVGYHDIGEGGHP